MNRPDWIKGASDQQLEQLVTKSGQLLSHYEYQQKPHAATIVRRHMVMAWAEQSHRQGSPTSPSFSNPL